MLDWYQLFIGCVLILWALSTPQDRNALRIVLIASLASEGIVDFITRQIHAPWKLVIPGAVETLTIIAMLSWARNRTGYLQAGLLFVAWIAHLLCYLHLKTGGQLPFFYDNYEAIIQVVAVGQLAVCYDTLRSIPVRLYYTFKSLGFAGGWSVHDAVVRSAILHRKGETENQTSR